MRPSVLFALAPCRLPASGLRPGGAASRLPLPHPPRPRPQTSRCPTRRPTSPGSSAPASTSIPKFRRCSATWMATAMRTSSWWQPAPRPCSRRSSSITRSKIPTTRYFGTGDVKITSTFTLHFDGSARDILIVFNWRQPQRNSKHTAKFVLINTPFETLSINPAKMRLKKKERPGDGNRGQHQRALSHRLGRPALALERAGHGRRRAGHAPQKLIPVRRAIMPFAWTSSRNPQP